MYHLFVLMSMTSFQFFLTSKNENTPIVAVLWEWMVRFVFPAGVDLKAFGISSR